MTPKSVRGFALVDALVALTLLAITLALALRSAETGRQLANSAFEAHAASALLGKLMGDPPAAELTGSDQVFDWTVRLIETPAEQSLLADLCVQSATVRSKRTGRSFAAGRVVVCPVEAGR